MMKKRHARKKLEKRNLNKCGIEKEKERNYDQNNSFYDESIKKN